MIHMLEKVFAGGGVAKRACASGAADTICETTGEDLLEIIDAERWILVGATDRCC